VVCIDGPYGEPIQFSHYERVLLISGGIGVTPCHSILKMLYHRAKHADIDTVPRFIHFVWSVRSVKEFALYMDDFQTILADNIGGRFKISLYASREKVSSMDTGVPWFAGRPPMNAVLDEGLSPYAFSQHIGEVEDAPSPGRSLAFFCGPAPLVSEAENLAVPKGYEVHVETFEL